jgi:23S rRNA-/tRNA-specific pseudouridylate synthase
VKIFDFTLPQRVALHAYEITFSHPVNHQLITVTAPYPEDFRSLLSRF